LVCALLARVLASGWVRDVEQVVVEAAVWCGSRAEDAVEALRRVVVDADALPLERVERSGVLW